MFEVSGDSTPKEMLNFLRGATVPEIVAVCVVVRKVSDYEVPTNGTKEQLLYGLRGVPGEILFQGIDAIFPSNCEDDDDDNGDEELDEDE